MTGSAKRWWRDYMLTRPARSPVLTWDQFSQLFLEKFIPITLREEYRRRFEHFQQGTMTVTQYETRFVDLAHHVIVLLPTEIERVRRFIDGLTYTIMLQMAKEAGSDISFQTSVNIARRIELVRAHERGPVSDKRPRHSASHGASRSHGPTMPYSGQPTFNANLAPISAPPLQSHYNGYPTRSDQFQLQLQQPRQQYGCYECGNICQIRRYYPRLSSNRSH
ncbi:uncharacterized protein [Nicotiana tomentosiformis]|uniref:uncharacterized protein n=1 Tax=Nicotiana tomentosiformis TaxID=4098 RepID=UPI00388C75B1